MYIYLQITDRYTFQPVGSQRREKKRKEERGRERKISVREKGKL